MLVCPYNADNSLQCTLSKTLKTLILELQLNLIC